MKLSRNILEDLNRPAGWIFPDKKVLDLPEKVLQFGTGVLLRGLPDYFIDKANNEGLFNGRVVVVKSTSNGGTAEFDEQDCLFTHCIRGVEDGQKIEEKRINASISRVLLAKEQWSEILACAENPAMEIIISNTTEVGIVLDSADKINAEPPSSFPGKLLAFLYHRFRFFKGDTAKGMIIIPTELVVDNGKKLKGIVLELAHIHSLDQSFIDWLHNANHFCSSLVDRIVPGKLPADEKEKVELVSGFEDELMIMSESYSLWAIETPGSAVNDKLSFSKAGKGVVLAENIQKYRELKLRLLNGTHTFNSGLAHLAGCVTVKQAMDHPLVSAYIARLMQQEICPAIVSTDITIDDAKDFAQAVRDRFSNPFIEHKWLSITLQYSSKMKLRNVPLILQYYKAYNKFPEWMALGFAAYILFMMCTEDDGKYYGTANGKTYPIQDDRAAWFADKCKQVKGADLVYTVLSDEAFWETDLTRLPGFNDAVTAKFNMLQNDGALETLKQMFNEKAEA